MEAMPIICPECGELVIVMPGGSFTLVVPEHQDRVTPFEECVASARVIAGGRMLMP